MSSAGYCWIIHYKRSGALSAGNLGHAAGTSCVSVTHDFADSRPHRFRTARRQPALLRCVVDRRAPDRARKLQHLAARLLAARSGTAPAGGGTGIAPAPADRGYPVHRYQRAGAGETARAASPGAALITSVPLHPAQWTGFDDFVGHRRRYEPEELMAKLARHGFAVARSAVFGMQPRSSRLLELGMWFLSHRRTQAIWLYNRVLMPLGVRFQKPLALAQGLIDTA